MNTRAEQPLFLQFGPWISGGLVILLLYLGREVAIPLALATFFCLLLSPIAGFLERRFRFPRSLSALLAIGACVTALGMFGWLVGRQAVQMSQEFPKYRDTFVSKIRVMRQSVTGKIGHATHSLDRILQETKPQINPGPPT